MTENTLSPEERADLKAKALKAFAGPYTLDHRACIVDPDGYIVADYSRRPGEGLEGQASYFEALAPCVILSLLTALEEAEGRIKAKDEALKPFADAAEMFAWPVGEPSSYRLNNGCRLTVGDLRRARDALSVTEGEK
jgi:hypothetical protein